VFWTSWDGRRWGRFRRRWDSSSRTHSGHSGIQPIHDLVKHFCFNRTVSVISSEPPWKDGNARKKTCLIKLELYITVYNFENFLFSIVGSLPKWLTHFYCIGNCRLCMAITRQFKTLFYKPSFALNDMLPNQELLTIEEIWTLKYKIPTMNISDSIVHHCLEWTSLLGFQANIIVIPSQQHTEQIYQKSNKKFYLKNCFCHM